MARDLPGNLSLEYRSDSLGLPIVIADTQWTHSNPPEGPIEARLLIDGEIHSSVFLDGSSLQTGDGIRVALSATSPLPTGRYSTEIQFEAPISGGHSLSAVTQEITVENRTDSDFGSGWALAGLESLELESDGAVYTNGLGLAIWYPLDQSDGTSDFDRPASGVLANSPLTQNADGTFTLSHQGGGDSQFDSSGRLVTQTNVSGNATTYEWNSVGELQSVTDIYGRITTFSRVDGRIANVTDWAGQSIDLVHNHSGQLTSITSEYHDDTGPQVPAVTYYGYDSGGRINSIGESVFYLTELEYDDGGRLSSANLPGNVVWDFDSVLTQAYVDTSTGTGTFQNPAPIFDPADATATWTNPLGDVQQFVVDSNGHVVEEIAADGTSTTYTRDADGRILTTTSADPDGAGSLVSPVTQNTYDDLGNLVQTVHPGGATESWVYHDQTGLLESHTNVRGQTTQYTWDAAGNLASITDVLGGITSWTYDEFGNVLTETSPDPDGSGPLPALLTEYVRDEFGRIIQTTTAGVTTYQTYDSADRITSSTDSLGNTTEYSWNGLGRLSTVTYPDPDGAGPLTAPTETRTWDWYGRLESETGIDGLTTQYEYDSRANLISATVLDPDGDGPLNDLVTSWTYDDLGRQLTETDTLGHVSAVSYDALGRVLTTTAPDPDGDGPLASPITTLQYDQLGRLIAQTNALGNQTTFTYDDAGNQISVTNAVGHTQTSTFNAAGQVVSTTDPLNNTTTFQYNAAGQLISTTLPDPDGSGPLTAPSSTATYDQLGRPVSTIDFNGQTSSQTYNELGQLTSSVDVNESTTTFEYNTNGQITSVTNTDGSNASVSSSASYDNLGRITHQTAADGTTSVTTYNDLGQVASVIDAAGETTTLDYDAFGRQIRVTGAAGDTSSIVYDDLSRIVLQTDGLGNSTSIEYDNLSRVIRQTDALAGSTTYTYDALGQTLSLTDPAGNKTSWLYDTLGQLIADINENGDTRSFAYDAAGRITTRIDRNGRIINFGYDQLGRQTSQQWNDAGIVVNTITTTYNNDQRVSAITDDDSSYVFTWDSAGRLLTVDNAGTQNVPHVVLTNVWDEWGRQTGLSANIDGIDDFVNTYTYDSNHRISSITQIDGNQTAGSIVSDKRIDLTYDERGQFASIARYEDLTATDEIVTSTFDYDTSARLTSLNHTFNDQALAGYTWTWNAADQITDYSSVRDGSVQFTYDQTGQLTSEARTNLAGEVTTQVYNFDDNGNRTSAGDQAAPSTYVTGPNNQTLSDGTYNYQYDAEGNRTSRTNITTAESVNYQWNHANLLTTVQFHNANGSLLRTVEYQYDALGRRIGKSVDDDGNGTVDRSEAFVYDGAGLLAQSDGAIQIGGPNGRLNQHGWVDDLVLVFEDSDGAGPQNTLLSSRLLHGPDIDQVFAQESATGDILWALADQQGTIKDWGQATEQNEDGTTQTEIVNHINIDAFGNILNVTNGNGDAVSLDDRLTVLPAYTGQIYDTDSGLHYFKARWYDSSIGQFTNEDPLGFAAGDANVRRFVGNEVTTNVDPTGLDDKNKTEDAVPSFEGEDIIRDDIKARPPFVVLYDRHDVTMHAGATRCPQFADATHVIGVNDITEADCILHQISEGGKRPIQTLAIIDHGAEIGKKPNVDWVQSLGNSEDAADVVFSPTLFINTVEQYVTDRPVIFLGGCNVAQTSEYCWRIADDLDAIVWAADVNVYWNPSSIFPVPFISLFGKWHKFDSQASNRK